MLLWKCSVANLEQPRTCICISLSVSVSQFMSWPYLHKMILYLKLMDLDERWNICSWMDVDVYCSQELRSKVTEVLMQVTLSLHLQIASPPSKCCCYLCLWKITYFFQVFKMDTFQDFRPKVILYSHQSRHGYHFQLTGIIVFALHWYDNIECLFNKAHQMKMCTWRKIMKKAWRNFTVWLRSKSNCWEVCTLSDLWRFMKLFLAAFF